VLGGGTLIKYIPYPVVTGYLSGVGVLIFLSQLPKLFGLPKGTPLLQGLISPELWKWQGLVTGLVTMAVMVTIPRITRKVPAAIYALLGGMFTYFLLKGLNGEAKDKSGNITTQSLFDYLGPHVQDEARRQNREQTPTYNSDQTVGLR